MYQKLAQQCTRVLKTYYDIFASRQSPTLTSNISDLSFLLWYLSSGSDIWEDGASLLVDLFRQERLPTGSQILGNNKTEVSSKHQHINNKILTRAYGMRLVLQFLTLQRRIQGEQNGWWIQVTIEEGLSITLVLEAILQFQASDQINCWRLEFPWFNNYYEGTVWQLEQKFLKIHLINMKFHINALNSWIEFKWKQYIILYVC